MRLLQLLLKGKTLRGLTCAPVRAVGCTVGGFGRAAWCSGGGDESAAHRAKLVSQSLRPLSPDEYVVLTGDGREISQTLAQNAERLPAGIEPEQKFDRVLVDVPCSG